MDMISLDAAVAITGISRSTLWRRVTAGRIGKGGKDARSRALLVLADVLPLTEVPLGASDLPVLLQADAGAAEAQADMGALFYVAGAEKAALYWLNEAAAQGHADAMQWLGIAHYAGGVYTRRSRKTTSPSCGSPGQRRWGTRWRGSKWPGCGPGGRAFEQLCRR